MEISKNSNRDVSSSGSACKLGEKFNAVVQCCTMKSILYFCTAYFILESRESSNIRATLPVLPDPSLMHVGKIKRTNIFSVLVGLPKLIVFPHNSFREHCSFITCISREASLITVSAKNWGVDNIGAKGRLAATDTAAAARS